MKDKTDRKTRDWEEELSKEATEERAREKASGGGAGSKISIQKRRFVLGGEVIGKELKAVVVDWVYLKTFYKKAFKEGEFSAPSCYAISADGDELTPHDKVAKPVNDTCEDCPHNEFGSAKQGRGKACADKRRLALIAADDLEDADGIAKAEIAVLEIPPTALKGWSAYLEELKEKTSRPIYTVITKITIDPDSDWPLPLFDLDSKIKDKEVIDALKERREELRDELLRPYPDEDDEDGGGKKRKGEKGDDDEDDTDDDGEDDDEDDEEDEKPAKKGKKAGKKTRKDESADEEDDDDDDSDDDGDDDDDRPSKKKRGKSKDDDDEDEDEDEEDADDDDKPRKRRKSRFGK